MKNKKGLLALMKDAPDHSLKSLIWLDTIRSISTRRSLSARHASKALDRNSTSNFTNASTLNLMKETNILARIKVVENNIWAMNLYIDTLKSTCRIITVIGLRRSLKTQESSVKNLKLSFLILRLNRLLCRSQPPRREKRANSDQ